MIGVVLFCRDSLVALQVGLGFVLEVSSVVNGDGLSWGWLCASALLVMLNGDTHFGWFICLPGR